MPYCLTTPYKGVVRHKAEFKADGSETLCLILLVIIRHKAELKFKVVLTNNIDLFIVIIVN